MKIVKLFDDYLNIAASQQNMSREQYAAFYMSEKSITEEGDTLTELNDMTLGQLERIEDYAEMIGDRMKGGQKLESWMFSQITGAVDNLNAVHDAMDGVDGIKEKKITVDWEDDENAFIFSDDGMVKVDYDGDFQYRGKWFSTAEHTGPEDLLKDLNKAFKGDKFVYISESKNSDALAKGIDSAIIKIDDSLSYTDFALAVAKVLIDEYGTHNFGPFMSVLHKELGLKESVVNEKKDDYPVYHNLYSSAINAVEIYANSQGYTLDPKEYGDAYIDAFFKPNDGKTKKDTLTLFKNDKEQKKSLHVQIYNRGNDKFELNMYIN